MASCTFSMRLFLLCSILCVNTVLFCDLWVMGGKNFNIRIIHCVVLRNEHEKNVGYYISAVVDTKGGRGSNCIFS